MLSFESLRKTNQNALLYQVPVRRSYEATKPEARNPPTAAGGVALNCQIAMCHALGASLRHITNALLYQWHLKAREYRFCSNAWQAMLRSTFLHEVDI